MLFDYALRALLLFFPILVNLLFEARALFVACFGLVKGATAGREEVPSMQYDDQAAPPLVLVEGFLGTGSFTVWGKLAIHLDFMIRPGNKSREGHGKTSRQPRRVILAK